MPKRKLGYEEKFSSVLETIRHSPEELNRVLETSGDIAHAARDMTKDELSLIAAYMKADLKEFADNVEDSKNSPFSLLLADSMWQALLDLTDRTKVEWVELFADLEHQGVYQSGDVIGLGHLVCERCGAKTQYIHPTIISDCHQCGSNAFSRIALKP
jgi:hypothetical protein